MTPEAATCASCGADIEGAGIVDRMRPLHPWCWMTECSAADHPGMFAIARDLAQREQHTEA